MRWSRLKQLIEGLWVSDLKLKILCTVHRGEDVAIGRYWVTLAGETIWEEPKRVAPDLVAGRENPVATEVTGVLREYVDGDPGELLEKGLRSDRWGLVALLCAADRRLGKRRLERWIKSPPTEAVRRILESRFPAKGDV